MFAVRRMRLSCILLLAFLMSFLCAVPAFAEDAPADGASAENPLAGKSVLFVGDSICEAICEAAGGRWETGKSITGWAGRIIENNGMTGANLGKSGASVSNCRGANMVVNQLAAQSQVNTDYDYVIMHGGVNDAWDSAPVGEMTEGFDGPFVYSTFAGGLEDMFHYAKETFPNSQFGFIINFQLPSATYGRLSDMTEYVDMTIKICEKWEIPYLDLYNNESINGELKGTTTAYLHDYIHPNKDGYDIITPYVENWLKTVADGTYAFPSEEPSESSDAVSEESSEAESEPVAESGEASDETSETSSEGGWFSVGNVVSLVISILVLLAAIATLTFTLLQRRKNRSK